MVNSGDWKGQTGGRGPRRESRITESLATVVTNDSRHRIGGSMEVSRAAMVFALAAIPLAALVGYWVAALPGMAVAMVLATVVTVIGLAWLSSALDAGDDYCYCPDHVHAIRYPDRCCRNQSRRSF